MSAMSDQTRHQKLLALRDEEIDFSDNPQLDEAFWEAAQILEPRDKKPISLRVDDDVLAFFQQDGPGYQTRMHAVLKAYVVAMRKKAVSHP
jgi:uncharacterized protein (DUF4415 family)